MAQNEKFSWNEKKMKNYFWKVASFEKESWSEWKKEERKKE